MSRHKLPRNKKTNTQTPDTPGGMVLQGNVLMWERHSPAPFRVYPPVLGSTKLEGTHFSAKQKKCKLIFNLNCTSYTLHYYKRRHCDEKNSDEGNETIQTTGHILDFFNCAKQCVEVMDHEHVTMSPCDLTQDLVVDGVPNANSRDRYIFGLWRKETRLERRIGFSVLSRTTTGKKFILQSYYTILLYTRTLCVMRIRWLLYLVVVVVLSCTAR